MIGIFRSLRLLAFPLPMMCLAGSLAAAAAAATAAAAAAAPLAAPHSLQVSWQNCPALGVSGAPVFGWCVPACASSADAAQTSYHIQVFSDAGNAVWDSGDVGSNSSVAVKYGGRALAAGTAYHWSVRTTTSCSSGPSAFSTRGLFITALRAADWNTSASWIGLGEKSSTFNLVRRVVEVPPKVQRALAFVTAQNSWGGMLMNYKLWVNGKLASVGPGRGEAPVSGGDGTFRTQPYNTVDLTPFLPAEGGPAVLALQTMQFSGVDPNTGPFPFPCAAGVQCNGPAQISNGPAVLMQIDVHLEGDQAATSWVTGEQTGWKVLDGDTWLHPDIRAKVCFGPGCSAGGGTGRVEHTDARHEPVGWRSDPQFDDAKWAEAVQISTLSLVKSELIPRMAGAAVEITEDIQPVRVSSDQSHFVDFGAEFSGGIRFSVKDGKAGQVVKFQSGELCTPMVFDPTAFDGLGQNVSDHCETVEHSWGWAWNYTLRDGEQTIEQHQYMIFRYLTVEFLLPLVTGDGTLEEGSPPTDWNVSAWGVNAPFDPSETYFNSSDPVLNRVWGIAANMLHRGVLDTYTDSNARERRPYGAIYKRTIVDDPFRFIRRVPSCSLFFVSLIPAGRYQRLTGWSLPATGCCCSAIMSCGLGTATAGSSPFQLGQLNGCSSHRCWHTRTTGRPAQ